MINKLKLYPSAAGRWVFCTGSAFLESICREKQPISPIALEGIEAHRTAAQLLRNEIPSKINPKFFSFLIPYLHFYNSEIKNAKKIFIETKVESPASLKINLSGTPDLVIYQDNLLIVADLKFGYSIIEPFENWQLITYAYLIHKKIEKPVDTEFVIVQPRASHKKGLVRKWRVSFSELSEFFSELEAIIISITNSSFSFKTGFHCRYCSGIPFCNAIKQEINTDIEAFKFDLPPKELSDSLTQIFKLSEQIKYVKEAFESLAETYIKDGKLIPNWDLRPGRGSIKWNKPATEIIKLGEQLGMDIQKPVPNLFTPLQAKQKGLISDEFFITNTQYHAGKLKLTALDNTEGIEAFKTKEPKDE